MRRRPLSALAGIVVVLAGCSSAHGHATTTGRAPHGVRPVHATTTHAITPPPPAQLPRGGTKILGHYRVVAYYGAAGAPALGVLGTTSPERAARAIIERAKPFASYHLPVQPAMELLATVAQASPGPDGDYSQPVPHATIRRYLRVVHEHKMLLVLDLQPGRASFLS